MVIAQYHICVHDRRVRQVASVLFALAVIVAPTPMLSQSVIELRQYTLHPGQRDVLIELFEREFIEGQEAMGMAILGQFRDLDRPDRFVWIRAFADMPSRATSLQAFYGGSVWQRNRAAANATMVDSDNVLLLRPARAGSGFALTGRSRPPRGTTISSSAVVVATLYSFDAPVEGRFVEFFEGHIRPRFEEAGGRLLAYFVTEPAANNFPRLPVREGEDVFVWFASFATEAEYAAHVTRRDASNGWRGMTEELAGWLTGPPEVLRLRPTPRSLIGN